MIYLREVKLSDANDLFKITSNSNVTKYLTWYPHESIEETKFVIENLYLTKSKDNIPNSYAICLKENDLVIGIIDFQIIKDEIGVGYFLDESYWGRGIMSHALSLVIEIALNDLGLDKLLIAHEALNIGSKKVILKNGFKYLYTLNEISRNEEQEVLYYQILRSDYFEK